MSPHWTDVKRSSRASRPFTLYPLNLQQRSQLLQLSQDPPTGFVRLEIFWLRAELVLLLPSCMNLFPLSIGILLLSLLIVIFPFLLSSWWSVTNNYIIKYVWEFQSLLQKLSAEQGGVEHLSSFPQQVCPGVLFSPLKGWETEIIFSNWGLPHCLQFKG